MRKTDHIQTKIYELVENTLCSIPEDVKNKLTEIYAAEDNEFARFHLKNILENIKIAKEKMLPVCQDTGIPVFYIKIGKKTKYDINIIEKGILNALKTEKMRKNFVDPLTRKIKENTAIVYYEFCEGKNIEINYLAKGSGSENMSALKMLSPNAEITEIKNFVIETVKKAGANPCPPIILGIGIGGNFEYSAMLSKKALMRRINERNHNNEIAEMENELLREVNNLGIGVMGFGGKNTCLAVNIETCPTHTAMLPIAINIQCWAARRGKIVI